MKRPKSAKAPATRGGRAFGDVVDSDIDDDDAALALFARWRHGGTGTGIAFPLDGHLGSTPFTLTASFLFFLEDLFDNPGIQHADHLSGDGNSSLTNAKY
jgi:hypothetical protein